MSNKNLSILAIVALIMVVLAFLQSKISNQAANTNENAVTYLIQGLPVSDIGSIEVAKAQDKFKLSLAGEQFVVASKENYPAKTEFVNELITKVLDIQTKEMITASKSNFADLDVTEDKAEAVVRFFDKSGKFLSGVVIGKSAPKGGSYVRLADGNNVYLADSSPRIKTSAMEYINQNLLAVSNADMTSVTVSGPDKQAYTLTPQANSEEVTINGMPAGKQLKTEAKSVFAALADLQFSDVMNAKSAPKDLNFNAIYVCRLKNTTIYTLQVAQKDGKIYIKCNADFTDKTEVMKENKVESEEELTKKETKLLARDAAEKFGKLTGGWVYQIEDYKGANLIKTKAELLEDIPKPQDPNKPVETADANSPAI